MSGKRFRFSLQRVLELRRREADGARQALAHARRARQEQEERVAEMRQRLTALQEHAPAPAEASVRGLRQHEARCQTARRACRAACAKLDALWEEESVAQGHLTEARRAEERLDTLREQERARHEKARTDAEAAFLDEQAVMRHRRHRLSSLL